MRFSVDQESVSEIESLLTSYSNDINKAFDQFQEEISEIVVRTNYKKLLTALQKIIDIYNDVICREMRSKLISDWAEEGASLHDFAEAVYMGEESEEAVRRVESSLYDIFSPKQYDNLLKLEFSGDSNAERDDFNKITGCFETLSREIDSIRENNIEIFNDRIEDNELYRFLIPIVEAVGISIKEFCDSARKEMEQLGDHYAEKMTSQEETVRESKSSGKLAKMELDQNVFDTAADIGVTADAVSGDSVKPAPSASDQENTKKDGDSVQSEPSGKVEMLTEDELVKKIAQEVLRMLKERDLTIKALNDMVEKNYEAIAEVQKIYGFWLPVSEKVKESSLESDKKEKKEKKSKNYGRYIVDSECKRVVNENLFEIRELMEKLDKKYRERFKTFDNRFNILAGLIKGIVSAVELAVFVKNPLPEQLNIMNGGMNMTSSSAGKLPVEKLGNPNVLKGIVRTAESISDKVEDSDPVKNIIDKVGNSTVLKSIKKKFWDLTKTEAEIEKWKSECNQYMYEHYHYKLLGKDIDEKSDYYYFHLAIKEVTTRGDRRALEDAIFAAERIVPSPKEKLSVVDEKGNTCSTDNKLTDNELADINRGRYINLVRAALSCERVEDEKANELTDKLFDAYRNGTKLGEIRPRIEFHPLEKNITLAMIRAIPEDDE